MASAYAKFVISGKNKQTGHSPCNIMLPLKDVQSLLCRQQAQLRLIVSKIIQSLGQVRSRNGSSTGDFRFSQSDA